MPLPESVDCFAIAATTGQRVGDLYDRVLGDGLVPLASALGHHEEPQLALSFPESRTWIGYGMNHLELLDRPEVYGRRSGVGLRRFPSGSLPRVRRRQVEGIPAPP